MMTLTPLSERQKYDRLPAEYWQDRIGICQQDLESSKRHSQGQNDVMALTNYLSWLKTRLVRSGGKL